MGVRILEDIHASEKCWVYSIGSGKGNMIIWGFKKEGARVCKVSLFSEGLGTFQPHPCKYQGSQYNNAVFFSGLGPGRQRPLIDASRGACEI